MSLPTSQPIPPAEPTTPANPANRRRTRRRVFIPPGSDAQRGLLKELVHRVTPSFDFFLFTVLAGLALAIAILIDSPAFFLLAALLSPFMAPVAGLAIATILGSGRFLLRMLAGILIGSLIIFAWGALTGWLARMWPGLVFQQAAYHALFSWPDMLLLALGAGLTAFTLIRSPQQRPLVTSVAMAYELYLPIGVAGFGLTSGLPGYWPNGMLVFLLHLTLAALVGAVVLVRTGLRPLNRAGYVIGAGFGGACLAALVVLTLGGNRFAPIFPALSVSPTSPSTAAVVMQPTPIPNQSATPRQLPSATAAVLPSQTNTPTNTLVPSRTPTVTTTPVPTPVWAYIHSSEGGGAIIRKDPSFTAPFTKSLLNGMLVQILPESITADGVTWSKVRTAQGDEGWIVRSLLTTATPVPGG